VANKTSLNSNFLKETPNKNNLYGYIFALAATGIWSGNFIVARNLADTVPPVSIAFWRWTVAVLVFTPFVLRQVIRDWPILKKHLPYLVISAVFGVTIFNTLIYIAGHTSTVINLSLISITFPIFIIILSRILFKERITLPKIIGIMLVTFGVILIITKGSLALLLQLEFFVGDIWMLLAAMLFAVYSLLLKKKPEEIKILPFQYTTFTMGLAMLLPFFLIEVSVVPPAVYSSEAILSIIYIGIGASLMSYLLWNKAIAIIGPVKSAMVYYTIPLFSGVLAFLILDEKLAVIHVYSAILIISGILLSNYNPQGLRLK
jgi:drug/metabolite transporter (DMT)-like permease